MNAPTLIISLLLLAVLAAIVGRGIYNKRSRKGGCSCGCSGCPGSGACHPKASGPQARER